MRVMLQIPLAAQELRQERLDAFRKGDLERLAAEARRDYDLPGFFPLRVVGLPEKDLRLELAPGEEALPETPDETDALPGILLEIEVEGEAEARRLIEQAERRGERSLSYGAGIDVPLTVLRGPGSWCPPGDAPPIFHRREAAEALIGAEKARAERLDGEGVNLVFFDEGICLDELRARLRGRFGSGQAGPRFRGGWRVSEGGNPVRLPGQARPGSHGTMVAFNALCLAPRANVWDLPALPPARVPNPVRWASFAAGALFWAEAGIVARLRLRYPGPWIFCHAWGLSDRRLERPRGWYSERPSHILNRLVAHLAAVDGRDQIFAAGNGGQFCPTAKYGPLDIGPWNSISGANALPEVLSVGAVRADAIWIGYSSQGPVPKVFSPGKEFGEKPDLCAPSHFVDATDAALLSSGTSAACGLAAGAVAALRTVAWDAKGAPRPKRPDPGGLPPAALYARLRETARKPPSMRAGQGYDIRHGHGVLDLGAALGKLAPPPAPPPPPPAPPPTTTVAMSWWGWLLACLAARWPGRGGRAGRPA